MSRSLKVLVVNPYITDFKLYDEWMHPLGLYFLIDLLTANEIDVYYFNCLERIIGAPGKKFGTGTFSSRVIHRPTPYRNLKRKYKCYGCTPERFYAHLRTIPSIDVVFIGTMMTYWVDGVLETIPLIRRQYPAVPVVCGGIAVRLMPEYFRNLQKDVYFCDSALIGEKTISLPGIPRELSPRTSPSLLSGLKADGPRFHGPLLLSLGCPLQCSYCASRELLGEEFILPLSDFTLQCHAMGLSAAVRHYVIPLLTALLPVRETAVLQGL